MFGCNNHRLFPEKYTMKEHISNTKLEKGDNYYIQTQHNYLFSHNNLFLGKLKKKDWLEKPAHILMRVYRIVLMPPGHPIILLKSN